MDTLKKWEDLVGAWARRLAPRSMAIDGEARSQDDYRNMLMTVAWLASLRFQREHRGGEVDEIRYVRGAIRRAVFSASRFRLTRERLRRQLASRVWDWEVLGWTSPEAAGDPASRYEAREGLRLVLDSGADLPALAGCDAQDSQALYKLRNRVRKSALGGDVRATCEI